MCSRHAASISSCSPPRRELLPCGGRERRIPVLFGSGGVWLLFSKSVDSLPRSENSHGTRPSASRPRSRRRGGCRPDGFGDRRLARPGRRADGPGRRQCRHARRGRQDRVEGRRPRTRRAAGSPRDRHEPRALASCDVVIEAITEDEAAKMATFRILAGILHEGTGAGAAGVALAALSAPAVLALGAAGLRRRAISTWLLPSSWGI